MNYSAFDRELLAVVAAIRHFRYMLEGRGFVVFTDHKPLVGALYRRSDPVSARQQHHLSFISEFAPTIRHITGDSNIVADTLSHPATAYSGPGEAAKRQAEVKAPSGSSAPPATAGPQSTCPIIGQAALPPGNHVATVEGPGAAVPRLTGVKEPSGSPVPTATARPSCPPTAGGFGGTGGSAAKLSGLPESAFFSCTPRVGDLHAGGAYPGRHLFGDFQAAGSRRLSPPNFRGYPRVGSPWH